MHPRTLLATAALAALLAAAALPGHAQSAGATTGAPSFAVSVAYVDFGMVGDPNDDCAYLEMSNPGGAVSVHDIRILQSFQPGAVCHGRQPGSLVVAEDTAETFPSPQLRTLQMTLKYVDGNGNGNYDGNDTLYLDSDGSPGLKPTSSTGSQVTPTIRLTPAGGHPAGTLVFSNHADFYGTGQGATPLASPSVAWLEKDANTIFGAADEPYLLPAHAPGYPAGSTIPLGALRLSEASFGTTVRAGGGTTATTSASTTAGASSSTTSEPTSSTPTPSSASSTPSSSSSTAAPSTPTAKFPTGQPRTSAPAKDSPAPALAVAAGLAVALALARRRLD